MSSNLKTILLLSILSFFVLSCAKTPTLPKIDLQQPSWTIWTGQAIWETSLDKTLNQENTVNKKISGDVLLAYNDSGDVVAQMTKGPIEIFYCHAITSTEHTNDRPQWLLRSVDTETTYNRWGQPPTQFIWFQIPKWLDQIQRLVHASTSTNKPINTVENVYVHAGFEWTVEYREDVLVIRQVEKNEKISLFLDSSLSSIAPVFSPAFASIPSSSFAILPPY